MRLAGTVRGVASGFALNASIKELLSAVGMQKIIEVVDVTHDRSADPTANEKPQSELEMSIALPATLLQYELACTNDDKDVYTFYYLYKNLGRTLIFVNSIKTAKR